MLKVLTTIDIMESITKHLLVTSLVSSYTGHEPSFFYIRVFIKIRHSNICLKFPCDAKLILPILLFNISRKNLTWKQHFSTDTSWNYLLSSMLVWWDCKSRRGRGRVRWGGRQWWGTFVWEATVDTMWRNLQYLAIVI